MFFVKQLKIPKVEIIEAVSKVPSKISLTTAQRPNDLFSF